MSFTIKHLKSLLKEYEIGKDGSEVELYSKYSVDKPMFINDDGNWVNILIDAVVTYNNNKHTAIIMTPVDAYNNKYKVNYYVKSTKATTKP